MTKIEIRGQAVESSERILTPAAIGFVADLERAFGARRRELLEQRRVIQERLDLGYLPDFLPETAAVRAGAWQINPLPPDLQDRRVEITGPVDGKMMINALNSGAQVFMADFEDAQAPAWGALLTGQANLIDAVDGRLEYTSPEGKRYLLADQTATLVVRPRGWHLPEKHLWVDGQPISAALFDFGLAFFHNARKLLAQGSGPYYYLPKLENHREARLWNDVFDFAEVRLDLAPGTIKATVLIETILAAFEMEEILYELKTHIAALNAGRWDYLFSAIKKFHRRPGFVLPDRAQITMTVPFMRAYTALLVETCHKRGAHAIGGMAAFVPSRKDAAVNQAAFLKVRQDKEREAGDGFDGTWVAHPDLVPVAREVFDRVLAGRPHQKDRLREEVRVTARELLALEVPGGTISEKGVRGNLRVALLYLESWLRGTGAVAIHNLMEDAATAEIARSQLWQWVHHPGTTLADGRPITLGLVREWLTLELDRVRLEVGAGPFAAGKFELAARLLERLVADEQFAEFLTLVAYDNLD